MNNNCFDEQNRYDLQIPSKCEGVDNFLTRFAVYGVIKMIRVGNRRWFMKSKSIFILLVGLPVFIFVLIASGAFAYTSGTPDTSAPSLINPFDFFKNDVLKNAAQNTGISTAVPSLPSFNLLDTKNLSFSDIPSSLKAIGVLAINLFLIVIQAVAAVLKGLLPFLSK